MHIQGTNFPKFINYNGVNKLNFLNVVRNNFVSNKSENDAFVKNSTSISFAGEIENVKKTGNIMDGLKTAAFVGTPFLVMLGATTAFAKMQNPEDIFLSDGTYIGSASDFNMKSEYLNVDGDDGIFQIKGIGIDIRPERFDEIDIAKGVYKNSDKGIDIDLLNNKYIDPENGIFVDPEFQISAILDGDTVKHVAIPSFEGAWSPEGSSTSLPYYMNSLGIEEDGFFPFLFDKLKSYIYIITGKDKYIPGYCVGKDGVRYTPQEWLSQQRDCFGREIVAVSEEKYLTSIPIDKKSQEIFKDFLDKGFSKIDAADLTNNMNFNNFLDTKGIDISFTSAEVLSGEPEILVNLSDNNDLYPDMNVIDTLLEELENNGELILTPNSYEAINFAIFQENLLAAGDIATPLVDFTDLLEPNTITESLSNLAKDGLIDNVDMYLESLKDIIESML